MCVSARVSARVRACEGECEGACVRGSEAKCVHECKPHLGHAGIRIDTSSHPDSICACRTSARPMSVCAVWLSVSVGWCTAVGAGVVVGVLELVAGVGDVVASASTCHLYNCAFACCNICLRMRMCTY